MKKADDLLIKHWLLNTAIEFPRSLSLLFPNVDGHALNVRSIDSVSAEDYGRLLTELFADGMIHLTSDFPGDDLHNASGISQILERFLRPAERPPSSGEGSNARSLRVDQKGHQTKKFVRFELTALGGETWGQLAKPDWTRFFTESRDDLTGEIMSPNLDLLMARMGWFPELNEEGIRLDTIRVRMCTNCQVLYWKRLPLVYQASFSLAPEVPGWMGGRSGEPQWFQEWWHAAGDWYKQPWDLPIWPSE